MKTVRNFTPSAFPPSVVNSLLRGYFESNEKRLNQFTLILVLDLDSSNLDNISDTEWWNEVWNRGLSLLKKYPVHSMTFGTLVGETFEQLLEIKNSNY